MRKYTFGILAGVLLTPAVSHAGSVQLYDGSFSFRVDGIPLTSGVYETRWGSFNAGFFTPFLGDSPSIEEEGHVDLSTHELVAILRQPDNFFAAPGSQMSLALTILNDDSNFSFFNSINTIILQDPSWMVPVLSLFFPDVTYSFTAQTQVAYLTGQSPATSYTYNGGDDIINITTIPEPAACAALVGLGALGITAVRRRRSRA